MKCNIFDMNNEGAGVTKIDNVVTFVDGGLIGDELDIEIIRKDKKFNNAKINKIINNSIERTIPICKYYNECGGCDLMHQLYKYQLEFKKRNVLNNLKHISDINIDNCEIVYDKELNYRNHVIFEVENDKIGFYKKNTNEIVNIDECLIVDNKINETLSNIKKFIELYKNNNIERISVKVFDEILICIYGEFKLIDEFKNIVKYNSLYINDKFIDGKNNINVSLGKYKYNVSSKTFFQKNIYITEKLYDYIKSLVNPNETVLDLYSGISSIGIYISDKVKEVTSIEVVEESTISAKENILLNNIDNISVICGKTEDNLDKFNNIDTIIVDPPRFGINRKGIEDIIRINSNKIIYVSCNSTTLARDINLLKNNYEISNIKLFDMFPNTHHCESVAILERR